MRRKGEKIISSIRGRLLPGFGENENALLARSILAAFLSTRGWILGRDGRQSGVVATLELSRDMFFIMLGVRAIPHANLTLSPYLSSAHGALAIKDPQLIK